MLSPQAHPFPVGVVEQAKGNVKLIDVIVGAAEVGSIAIRKEQVTELPTLTHDRGYAVDAATLLPPDSTGV